ncbi:MAG TPA: patatin-like phospholipase family protein [Dokdonella sp.]|nr:patatin-like phospholipase family protein [Dokdonella sp.]
MDKKAVLSASPLFRDIAPDALEAIAARFDIEELRGGRMLFREGDLPDYLYVVATGRLQAQQADGTVIGEIGRGQPVGEMALLSGETRGADVVALRDSLLLRINRVALLDIVSRHPSALLALCGTIARRSRRPARRARLDAARGNRTVAVIRAQPGVRLAPLVERLLGGMRKTGKVVRCIGAADVDKQFGEGAAQTPFGAGDRHRIISAWLERRELAGGHLVLWSDATGEQWTERCLRQSDRVIVVVQSDGGQPGVALARTLRQHAPRTPVDLLVLRPDGAPAGDVLEWRVLFGARSHYFARPDAQADHDAVARQLTGHGLGVVFGGGGARGFAHVGLVRAMEDLGITADIVGGTSMGAFFAALHATGASSRDMLAIGRATFVDRNYLNDYVWPSVSLIRGRKFLKRLRAVFGDVRIEDLRVPYFCITSNLTRGRQEVHESGSLAVWVGTSMCVPGIAPPVAWNGCLLVDGAVANCLPVDVMHALGRGPIIASDVAAGGGLDAPGIVGPDPEALLHRRTNPSRISLFGLLVSGFTPTRETGPGAREELADLHLRMPVQGVRMFGWREVQALVDRSYEYSMAALKGYLGERQRNDRARADRREGVAVRTRAAASPAAPAGTAPTARTRSSL